jgi:hypothetical protein
MLGRARRAGAYKSTASSSGSSRTTPAGRPAAGPMTSGPAAADMEGVDDVREAEPHRALNPLATLFSQARFCAERISISLLSMTTGVTRASSRSFGNRDLDCPGRGVMLWPRVLVREPGAVRPAHMPAADPLGHAVHDRRGRPDGIRLAGHAPAGQPASPGGSCAARSCRRGRPAIWGSRRSCSPGRRTAASWAA